MNIFITGGTGFIGKAFLRKLLSTKERNINKIFLLQRERKSYSEKNIDVLIGDLSELNKYEKEILSCQYVFHIAANATFGNKIDYDVVNLEPTKSLINILEKSKILKNFIFISTIGAVDRNSNDKILKPLDQKSIPSPTSSYGKSKLKAEKYLERSGISYTIIRPTWVYGSDMRKNSHINKFVSIINRSEWVAKLGFKGKVSLIHVDDLAVSLVNCINNKEAIGKKFFAETESLSFGEIFEEIYKKLKHKNIKQVKIPTFRFVFQKIHRCLPLLLTNLFIDYLLANDELYKKILLNNKETIKFKKGIDDVIKTNVDINGFWVITGANSGIGYSLAKILDKKEKKIILIDKNKDKMSLFKRQTVIKSDLSEEKNLKKIGSFLEDKKIFCLINNAGIGFKKEFFELSLEEINLTINVNIKAILVLTALLRKNLRDNCSTIVNIGSSAGYNPLPGMSLYAASKSFVINMTRGLIGEVYGRNKVILFSPSGTATNFQKNAGVYSDPKKQRLLNPDFVAEKILKIVDKEKSKEVMLGFKSKILVLIGAFLPSLINIKMQKILFKKLR